MVAGNTHAQKVELNVELRTVLGSKVKSLRRGGFMPAVLYGRGQESLSLQVPVKDFQKVLKEAGESTLVYVNADGKTYPTIIHDVFRDALTDDILHADFYKVRLDEKIKAMVPVVFEGEAPAVIEQGGTFIRNVNELEVEALPQDLPHEIKVDISGLKEFEQQILLKDIKLGSGSHLTGNPEEIIATVQKPLSEEELKKMLEGDVAKTVEDVEEIKKEPGVEGEEAAEETPVIGTPVPAPAAEKTDEK